MPKYRGTVKKNDLEGGFWELVADDGETYQLRGADAKVLVDGKRVEIDGKIDKDAFGIGMTGPILDVGSCKSL
jgi:hypothetical protein